MAASTTPVATGTSEARGPDRFRVHFELHLPHGYEQLWTVLTTDEGLRTWLCAAEVLERRLGGAVSLRWLNGPSARAGRTFRGHVTAWDVEHVVEYTVAEHGRIRFHLDAVGTDSTVIRFTDERTGSEADRLDCLAGWHDHFERLAFALEGRPTDWGSWTDARWARLRAEYAAVDRAR
ncbi:SRPBCC domain-containing protein [Streptomyces sp. NPDC006879]|uniref:SRPBCC domain-containing protein n=1 Tax=Streptomyces sp. NPDC006879 TaxID=3364767 RepID=UPI0036BDE6D7